MTHERLILGTIPKFRRALADAVQDQVLENDGCELQYLFDTDVVIGSLFALDDFQSKMSLSRLRKFIVGVLWYYGAVGKVAMLSPHRYEFDLKIDSRDQKPTTTLASTVKATMALNAQLGKQESQQLKKILRSKEQNPQETLDFYIAAGPIIIPILESVGVDWRNRLAALYKDRWLHLDPQGPSYSDVLHYEHSGIEKTTELILSLRRQQNSANVMRMRSDKELFQNSRTDAAALHTLASLIRNPDDENSPKRLYRFLTSTRSLRTACFESEYLVRHLHAPHGRELTHWQRGTSDSHDYFPFRSPGYFMLRASFPALAHPGITLESDPLYEVEIEELKQLSEDLRELLVSNPTKQILHVSKLSLGGRPLTEVLREFTSIGMVNRIWNRNAKAIMNKSGVTNSDILKEWAGIIDVGQFVSDSYSGDKYWTRIKSDVRNAIRSVEKWSEQVSQFDDHLKAYPVSQADLPLLIPSDFGIDWWLQSDDFDFETTKVMVHDLLSPQSPQSTRQERTEQLVMLINNPNAITAHERLALACMLHEIGADTMANRILQCFTHAHNSPPGSDLSCWLFLKYLSARSSSLTAPDKLMEHCQALARHARAWPEIHKLSAARVLFEYLRALFLDELGVPSSREDLKPILESILKRAIELARSASDGMERKNRTSHYSYWYAAMLYVQLRSKPWSDDADARIVTLKEKIIDCAPKHRAFVELRAEPQIQSIIADMEICKKGEDNEHNWNTREEIMRYSLSQAKETIMMPRLAKWGASYKFLLQQIAALEREISRHVNRDREHP